MPFSISDQERHLCSPKYIIQVSMCLCLYMTFIWRSLHFSVRVFPFLSHLLSYDNYITFIPWYNSILRAKVYQHAALIKLTYNHPENLLFLQTSKLSIFLPTSILITNLVSRISIPHRK